MKRDKLKSKIEDLMGQYDREEIDGDTYMRRMPDSLIWSPRLGHIWRC